MGSGGRSSKAIGRAVARSARRASNERECECLNTVQNVWDDEQLSKTDIVNPELLVSQSLQ